MSYFKSSFYDSVKLFLAQIALAVYGFVTAGATLNNPLLMVGASVLGILLYFLVIYDFMWEVGGTDRIHNDVTGEKANFGKPVYVSLIANIPNFIFAILTLVSYFGDMTGLYEISNAVLRMIQAVYIGLFENIVINGMELNANPFAYTVTPFISVFITFAVYVLGYKNIKLLPEKKTKK